MTTTTPHHRAGRPHRRRISTTRTTLLRLFAALLITTGVVFGTALQAFLSVHRTADTVHNRTAPAIVQLTIARAALVKADYAAINSFRTGEARLAGPREEFQNQVAVARQSLTRVAENNTTGSLTLHLIEGLLATYQGLIGQADAHFRQSNVSMLGTADLWRASNLLHNSNTGILAQLDKLLIEQKGALNTQLSNNSTIAVTVLKVLVPIACLATLLIGAQLTLRRRFRRSMSPGLLLAAACLIVLAPLACSPVTSQYHLEASRQSLNHLVGDWQKDMQGTEIRSQQELIELMKRTCGDDFVACGDTATGFAKAVAQRENAGIEEDDGQLARRARGVNERTGSATARAGWEPLIYLLSIVIAIAILAGFLPRLNEYRYRPR